MKREEMEWILRAVMHDTLYEAKKIRPWKSRDYLQVYFSYSVQTNLTKRQNPSNVAAR